MLNTITKISNAIYPPSLKLKIKNFIYTHCYKLACLLLFINIVVNFSHIFFTPSNSEQVQNRLWNHEFFSLSRISIYITLPMLINFLIDYWRERNDKEKQSIFFSRSLTVSGLLIPGIIQLTLPYGSYPSLSWDILEGIKMTQNIFIIAGLMISMYRYDVIVKKNKISKYNIIRGSLKSLTLLFLVRLFVVISRKRTTRGLLITLSIFTTFYIYYIIVRQLRCLYGETINGKFRSSQAFSDFLHVIVLLLYLSSNTFYVMTQTLRGERASQDSNSILYSRFLTLSTLVYTILLTLIPIRVNLFQAELYKEKLEEKLNMIRYVSHEMRTPLNTVSLGLQCVDMQLVQFKDNLNEQEKTSESVENRKKTEIKIENDEFTLDNVELMEKPKKRLHEMKDGVKLVGTSCDVVLATLNDLLTADKLEDDKLSLDLAKLDITIWDLVKEVGDSFVLLAKDKGIKYNVLCVNEGEKWFEEMVFNVDKFKLSQVVRNFISNAIKFTPVNGEVLVSLEFIENIANNDFNPYNTGFTENLQKYVKFVVKDSGAGIKKENLSKLFQQYVQFDAAKLQKGNGSGLGLWISKQIIELHGGTIGAHSEGEGTGCTFYFNLPLQHQVELQVKPEILMESEKKNSNKIYPAIEK